MMDIELQNLNERGREEQQEEDGEEETSMDDGDLLSGLDWLSQRGKDDIEALNNYSKQMKGFFGNVQRGKMARDIGLFIQHKLDVPGEYQRPGFIKHLMDRQTFTIRKIVWNDDDTGDYEIEYYGKPFENEDGTMIRPLREIKTIDGALEDMDEFEMANNLDHIYDEWKAIDRAKKLKRAGLIGTIAITVGGIITVMSLGLKRSGHQMKHDAKVKSKKLTPAERRHQVIPWTDIEEASGDATIWIGDHLLLVIGGTIVYVISKRGRKPSHR